MNSAVLVRAAILKVASDFYYRPLDTGHAAATGAILGGAAGGGLGALSGLFADEGEKGRTALRNGLVGALGGAGLGGAAGAIGAPVAREAMGEGMSKDMSPMIQGTVLDRATDLAQANAQGNGSDAGTGLDFLNLSHGEQAGRVQPAISDALSEDFLPNVGMTGKDILGVLFGKTPLEESSIRDQINKSVGDAWGSSSPEETEDLMQNSIARRIVGLGGQ